MRHETECAAVLFVFHQNEGELSCLSLKTCATCTYAFEYGYKTVKCGD